VYVVVTGSAGDAGVAVDMLAVVVTTAGVKFTGGGIVSVTASGADVVGVTGAALVVAVRLPAGTTVKVPVAVTVWRTPETVTVY